MKSTDTTKQSESIFDKLADLPVIHRVLICVVTFSALIGAFLFISYIPQKDELATLSDKLESLEKKLADAKQQAKKLERLRMEKKEAENQFRIVLRALPDKKEIPKLLTSISQSGRNAGLEFLLFKPQKEKVKDFYAEIPVDIKVVGNYHNLASFFGRMAQLHRIVNIEDIKIGVLGADNRKVETSCKAVTYKFVEPEKNQKAKTKTRKKKKR